MTEKTDTKNPSLLKKWWKTIAGAVAVCGLVWGVLEGVYFFTEQWHEYQTFKENEENIIGRIQRLEENQKKLLKFYESKQKSYAVGFRVITVSDEYTGNEFTKKTFRDWDGSVHTVYKDTYLSDIEGYDYYFWVDKNGDRQYCW